MGGTGVDPGVEQRVEALLDVAVVAEGQGGDAHDAGLPGAEAGGLDVDDGPARAGLVCRPAPGLAHVLRMARCPDKPGHPPDRWPACRLPKMPGMVTTRGRVALAAGAGARWASRVTGRGAGAMIGGLVAMALDKSILRQLGEGRRTVVVTGTNGKSTTTRMTAAALGTLGLRSRRGGDIRPSPPMPRARTWTPDSWPRWRARVTLGWPRWRSTRCTCRMSPTPWTRR